MYFKMSDTELIKADECVSELRKSFYSIVAGSEAATLPERAIAAYLWIDQLARNVREWKKLAEDSLIEWLEYNKCDIEICDLRYYVGKDKKVKVEDKEAVVKALLNSCGGDISALCEALASEPFKYATVKSLVGPEKHKELFDISYTSDIKTGAPKKKLKVVDKNFLPGVSI